MTERAPDSAPEQVARSPNASSDRAPARVAGPVEYALAYAALGWPVLPVGTEKKPLGGRGIKHASTDEKTIRAWWARWPQQAGIGIHLAAAGLCAIDIDPRAGTTKMPADFPATLTARTGGGGWHLIYKAPEGVALPGKLEAGIDVKHRGYVIVEPSQHPSGGRYAWVDFDPLMASLVGAPTIAEFPLELLDARAEAPAIEAGELEQLADLANIADETIEELHGALDVIPSDDRDQWVRFLHALKPLGERGRELALEWSQRSAKFDADDFERVWDSVKGDRTGYPAIFAEAQRRGWANPKSAKAQDYSELVDFTDVGNANLLAQLTDGDLRYVPERKLWIYWDGEKWLEDTHGALAQRAALRVAQHYHQRRLEIVERAAGAAVEAAERKRLLATAKAMKKWELHCRQKSAIDAMLVVASRFTRVQVPLESLNRDPFLLGVENGVVDLRTGALRAAGRDDLVTKRCPVPFNPSADAPRWRQFVDEITGAPLPVERDAAGGIIAASVGRFKRRPELAAYLQRALGYGLTGSVAEHKIFVVIGSGANGKNVALDSVQRVAGDYWVTIAPEALMTTRHDADAERPTPTAASLAGARAAISSESKDGQRLDVALVKRHTGGGYMTARQMRENTFRFEITHKLWLMTNHQPALDHLDDAIRGRLHLIPFERQWNRPGHPERDPALPDGDKDLLETLRGEAEGILAWLVAGAVAYVREGLEPPPEVARRTRDYFRGQDLLGQWLEGYERCDARAGQAGSALFDAFANWCAEHDEDDWAPNTQTAFSLALQRRGFEGVRTKAGKLYGLRPRAAEVLA